MEMDQLKSDRNESEINCETIKSTIPCKICSRKFLPDRLVSINVNQLLNC